MKKTFLAVFILIFLSGCTTIQGPVKVKATKQSPVIDEKNILEEDSGGNQTQTATGQSVDLQNIEEEKLEEYVEQNGILFGKTDFQGVLKTPFVKLTIVNKEKADRVYTLYVGEAQNVQTMPWDFKPVEPGYFFIELPVGKYKISTVSIPVGSTIATEKADISFEIDPNKIIYGGTLKMIGVKEKIKLGGVPVLQPGFEYTVEVVDDRIEGLQEFRQRYPDFSGEIIVDLMGLNIK